MQRQPSHQKNDEALFVQEFASAGNSYLNHYLDNKNVRDALMLFYRTPRDNLNNRYGSARSCIIAVTSLLDPAQKENLPNLLHEVCSQGHYAIAQLLVTKLDVDVNHQIPDSLKTVLHCAAEKGNAAILQMLLLEGNAHPDIRDKDGDTFLDSAYKNHHVGEMAELLMRILRETVDSNKPSTLLVNLLALAANDTRKALFSNLIDRLLDDTEDNHSHSIQEIACLINLIAAGKYAAELTETLQNALSDENKLKTLNLEALRDTIKNLSIHAANPLASFVEKHGFYCEVLSNAIKGNLEPDKLRNFLKSKECQSILVMKNTKQNILELATQANASTLRTLLNEVAFDINIIHDIFRATLSENKINVNNVEIVAERLKRNHINIQSDLDQHLYNMIDNPPKEHLEKTLRTLCNLGANPDTMIVQKKYSPFLEEKRVRLTRCNSAGTPSNHSSYFQSSKKTDIQDIIINELKEIREKLNSKATSYLTTTQKSSTRSGEMANYLKTQEEKLCSCKENEVEFCQILNQIKLASEKKIAQFLQGDNVKKKVYTEPSEIQDLWKSHSNHSYFRHLCHLLQICGDPDLTEDGFLDNLVKLATNKPLLSSKWLEKTSGKNALHLAIEKNNSESTKILLQTFKANPNIPMQGIKTPLYLAINNNNVNAVEALLSDKRIPHSQKTRALTLAERGTNKIIASILRDDLKKKSEGKKI